MRYTVEKDNYHFVLLKVAKMVEFLRKNHDSYLSLLHTFTSGQEFFFSDFDDDQVQEGVQVVGPGHPGEIVGQDAVVDQIEYDVDVHHVVGGGLGEVVELFDDAHQDGFDAGRVHNMLHGRGLVCKETR